MAASEKDEEVIAGPKAPKNPRIKGSSFFICKGKDIAGNPQPDGGGIQTIYLNDIRLITFARMVGNITDESMLEHLKTAEGFRKMVAGIGVAVESEDSKQEVLFEFQMCGKRGSDNSGTKVQVRCRTDGMEQLLWLDDYNWSEADAAPQLLRFHFARAGELARADVKLYLREGFSAPEEETVYAVDFSSPEYHQIMERSLLQTGNTDRIKEVLKRARNGEDVTIAFIGGSITQGAGAIPIHRCSYAYRTWKEFQKIYGKGDHVHYIKAGIGGTSSELGIVRLDRDVLRDGTCTPDLVVVEYAVNDEGDETQGVSYECLVRRLLFLSDHTAVVLLFAVFADDWNLQARLMPIGQRYQLPMVSIRDGVTAQFYQKQGEGRVLSKRQFFYDAYHPSNYGHRIMADCLMYLLDQVDRRPEKRPFDWRKESPVYGSDLCPVHLIDRVSHIDKPYWIEPGSFGQQDEDLQVVERDFDFAPTPQFSYNWQHRSGKEPFRMKLRCRALLLISKDSGSADAGKAVIKVDGRIVKSVDPQEVGWTHCYTHMLFSEPEVKEHLVEVAMETGDEEKCFTILGFGYVDS